MRRKREGRQEIRPVPASGQSLLHRLNGAQLISVTFIHDYLVLAFELVAEDGQLIDTAGLDCDVWPKVVIEDEVLSQGTPGYRDALCECINATVTTVKDDVASGMQLQFPGRSLVFRPSLDELVGPEIALLRFSDSPEWDVWRPGEDSFAYLA